MGVGVLGRQFAGGAKFGKSFLLLWHQKAPSLRADGAQAWRWVRVSLLHLEPATSQIFNSRLLQDPDSGPDAVSPPCYAAEAPFGQTSQHDRLSWANRTELFCLAERRRHHTWSQQNRTTQNIFPCAGSGCKGRRENVPRGRLDRRVSAVVVQDKCPPKRSAEMSPVYWGIVSDVDAGRVAGDRRVGGVSVSM